MITKTYDNIDKFNFHVKFFELYNVIQTNKELRLRKSEIEVLSAFLSLPDINKFTMFNPRNKDKAVKLLEESTGDKMSVKTINVHLFEIRKKNIIVKQSDGMDYVNPSIIKYLNPEQKHFEFVFKFNIE